MRQSLRNDIVIWSNQNLGIPRSAHVAALSGPVPPLPTILTTLDPQSQ